LENTKKKKTLETLINHFLFSLEL